MLRLGGAETRMGIRLHATFLVAGLRALAMRLVAVVGVRSNISHILRVVHPLPINGSSGSGR
jgi:hypothetical protein